MSPPRRVGRLAPAMGVLLAVGLVAGAASAVVVAPTDPGGPTARASASTPAAGQDEAAVLQNDEVVLATLDPSGLPEDAVLVSTVTARAGPARVVEDPASTTNVDYLDRRGSPEVTTDAVLVEVGGAGTTSAVTQATFDKPLPVALHAEYALDGTVLAPERLLGSSGEITVRYTVTNTTAQRETLRYRDASGRPAERELPVFVPFTGSLTVVLPRGSDLLDAGTGVQATDAQGRAVVRYDLLLAPPLGTFQQEAVLTLRTGDAATPAAVLEVVPTPSDADPPAAFAAGSLQASAEGSAELYEGVSALGEQTGAAADGAALLADGSLALAAGADALARQVGGPLLAGSQALAAGADTLAGGADALASGLAAAEPGVAGLAAGAQALSGGLVTLSDGLGRLGAPDGLPAAVLAADGLEAGANQVADALGAASDGPWPPPGTLPPLPDLSGLTLDDLLALTPEQLAALKDRLGSLDLEGLSDSVPPPTVVQSLRLLQQATDALTRLAAVLVLGDGQHAALLAEAAASAGSAAAGAAGLFAQVCGPTPTLSAQQCDQLEAVAADAAAAKAAVVKAQLVSGVLLAGVAGVDAALGVLETAVAQVSAGVRSGSFEEPGLVEGLALLADGLEQSTAAVQALQAGAASAAAGSEALAVGAAGVATGVGEAAGGAEQLAAGASGLAAGTQAQADGVGALAAGTDALASGAGEAARGSAALAGGLQRLQVEGVDALGAAVLEASTEPALASAWVAATDARVADALPYGPPEGAVGFAAYRLTMPATAVSGTPAWQWALLGAAVLAAAAWAAWRRLAAPVPSPQ